MAGTAGSISSETPAGSNKADVIAGAHQSSPSFSRRCRSELGDSDLTTLVEVSDGAIVLNLVATLIVRERMAPRTSVLRQT
ncbi:MAG TPA: hypothetical protein VNO32_37045, partial [Candidatus Acidoferrum sp.]|nr:hypothetical protein [Candidatus Acidoferrum sp.]